MKQLLKPRYVELSIDNKLQVAEPRCVMIRDSLCSEDYSGDNEHPLRHPVHETPVTS